MQMMKAKNLKKNEKDRGLFQDFSECTTFTKSLNGFMTNSDPFVQIIRVAALHSVEIREFYSPIFLSNNFCEMLQTE